MQAYIYHLVDTTYLENFRQEQGASATYFPATFEEEGFIHCCTEAQIEKVLPRYFSDIPKVKMIVVATKEIPSPIKYEAGADQDLYPHIYGGIPVQAISAIKNIR